MKLIVDSARFKLLLICLLAQPLWTIAADEPKDGNCRDSVQLVKITGPAEESNSSSVAADYSDSAKVTSVKVTSLDTSLEAGRGHGRGDNHLSTANLHPLEPLVAMAQEAAACIAADIEDYTCMLVKRERVGGRLLPEETIFAKVRHWAPPAEGDADRCRQTQFYLRFESPSHLSGREILFPCPGSDGHLLVRNGGARLAFVTLQLTPDCALAMRGNRYPVTEFGIERLVQRMIELGKKELVHDECEVTIREGAAVDERSCRCIEVLHPVPREYFNYHIARIYIDDELQLPIRFEAYDWPGEKNGEPQLIEEYTYRNLQLNVGLTSDDFRRDHPAYKFSLR